MNDKKRITVNLQSGMMMVLITNILGAILILMAYVTTGNIWFLIAGILVAGAGVGFLMIMGRLRNKISKALDSAEKKEKTSDI